MVEHTAHNGQVVGSTPTKLISIYCFNLYDACFEKYKNKKIKKNFK